jgi:hypothetical protein
VTCPGLRPPSMIAVRPVVRPARLGLRLKPPAHVPADSWGQGHWPGYRATGRVIRPLAAPLGEQQGMLHAGTRPVRRCGPGSSGHRAREHCANAVLGPPPGVHPNADWPRPARCPRGRRSRAPLAIRLTEPAQLTAHKRAGLHCLPAPRVYGADGDPPTATTARPAPTERPRAASGDASRRSAAPRTARLTPKAIG